MLISHVRYNNLNDLNNINKTMELLLKREVFNNTNTIGKLYIDGKFAMHVLEDKDRNLTKEDSLSKIKQVKVAKNTCIPYGRYRVILSYSVKLKRYLPLILDVPGWRGIRMHKGSTEKWSSGCPLVGLELKTSKLSKIKEAEEQLVNTLDSVNRTQAIYITITK